jgi:hypothetical protein
MTFLRLCGERLGEIFTETSNFAERTAMSFRDLLYCVLLPPGLVSYYCLHGFIFFFGHDVRVNDFTVNFIQAR